MFIQDSLAFSQGRKDQEPNKLLAHAIVNSMGDQGVRELIDFLETKPHKELQKDGALTLAWVAQLKPEMVAPHTGYLIGNLKNPINRVIWASMIALAAVAHLQKENIYEALPEIIDAMEAGTVVTRDYGFRILIVLYQDDQFQEDVFLLIREQLLRAPSNQLGQYTERLIEVIHESHLSSFIEVLEERSRDLINEYHLKRLNKNLKKLYKRTK